MIAFLRNEPGAEAVEEILTNPSHQCIAHVVNLSELYTWFAKHGGIPVAESAVADLIAAGIEQRYDIDDPYWKSVGRLRSEKHLRPIRLPARKTPFHLPIAS